MSENKTSRNTRDYEIGRGKPPVHSRFKKGQLGNPRGPRPKNLPALPIEALNEWLVVTIDGERRVGGVLTGCGAEMISGYRSGRGLTSCLGTAADAAVALPFQ